MARRNGGLDRLETRLDGVHTRLRLGTKASALTGKINLLTTQIVAKLPSGWQMRVVIGSTVILLAALWVSRVSFPGPLPL